MNESVHESWLRLCLTMVCWVEALTLDPVVQVVSSVFDIVDAGVCTEIQLCLAESLDLELCS